MYKVIFVIGMRDERGYIFPQTQVVEFETFEEAEAAVEVGLASRIAEVDVIRLYLV